MRKDLQSTLILKNYILNRSLHVKAISKFLIPLEHVCTFLLQNVFLMRQSF